MKNSDLIESSGWFCFPSFIAICSFSLKALPFSTLKFMQLGFCLSKNIYLLLYTVSYYRATTHSDLVVRAKSLAIEVRVVYNASVMNAIGICGLQLYRYGETVSIPFFTETWKPSSFYEKIQKNRGLGLHTLCLLGRISVLNQALVARDMLISLMLQTKILWLQQEK